VGNSLTGTQQLNGDISLMTVSPVDLDVSSWSSNSGSKINFKYDSLGGIEKRVISLSSSDYSMTVTYK
jgi:hypothetical protein